MRVTFWGVRGSIPTPGANTVRYGGNTSCVELRLADGTIIILDGGTGIRDLGKQLLKEGSRSPLHLLITHMHWDHIHGLPFFRPIYQPDTKLVLYPMGRDSRPRAHEAIFDGEHFPVRVEQLPSVVECADVGTGAFRIGSAMIARVSLNHPGGATGYRIDDADGASLAFLTDNELQPPGARSVSMSELGRFARGVGALVHDAQYLASDMPAKIGWGHSTVTEVLELGRIAESERLVLYHHDPERDDDALDAVAAQSGAWWKERVGVGSVAVAAEKLTFEIPAR